jgi:hypothetical protein
MVESEQAQRVHAHTEKLEVTNIQAWSIRIETSASLKAPEHVLEKRARQSRLCLLGFRTLLVVTTWEAPIKRYSINARHPPHLKKRDISKTWQLAQRRP